MGSINNTQKFKWLFPLGIAFTVLGAFFKIEHLPYATFLLTIGVATVIVAFIIELMITKEKGLKAYLRFSKIFFYASPLVVIFNKSLITYLIPIYVVLLLLYFGNFLYDTFYEKKQS